MVNGLYESIQPDTHTANDGSKSLTLFLIFHSRYCLWHIKHVKEIQIVKIFENNCWISKFIKKNIQK